MNFLFQYIYLTNCTKKLKFNEKMKKNYQKVIPILVVMACYFSQNGNRLKAQVVQTFSYTGSVQTFVVPSCVSTITLDVKGAQGANALDVLTTNSSGGLGGRAQGILTVTAGQTLSIYVGGIGNANGSGGFNGGGAGGVSTAGSSCSGGPAGGGGGASDIRVGGIALTNRVVVAGGGGGAGRDYCNGTCQPCGCGGSGGAGGGLTGLAGFAANNCGYSYPGSGVNFGAGGSSLSGGAGGPGDGTGSPGSAGTLGVGGSGAAGTLDVAAGGGGGGYYGGGGGGGASSGAGIGGGGGGGGSSYVTGLTNGTTTQSLQAGNGFVTLTYNFNGAGVVANASSYSICSGSSATLTASNVLSYTWSPGGSNLPSIVVAPTSSGNYTVQGTNSIGCISTSILSLTVSTGVPVLSILSSTTSICPSNTVMLTANGALTYSWTGGISNGVQFSPASTSNYTVIGYNGCGTSTAVTAVTVTPLPVLGISTPTIVCSANTATLSAGGASNYTWQPGGLIGANIVVSPLSTTIYTVFGTSNICSGVNTVTLPVNPIPTLNIVASSSMVCVGATANLSASGALNYTWQPGGLTGANVAVTPTGPTLYTATGNNSFGCTSSANQVVLVTQSPTVTLNASSTFICSGSTVTLTAGGANTYNWSSGSTNPVISVSPLNTSVYSVTGTSTVTGCSTTNTVSISVFTKTISISSATTVCIGTPITLNAGGATTYTWNTGFVGNSLPITPTNSAVYLVTANTVTLGMNCPSTASVSVGVFPNPTITAVANRTTMCRGEKNTLTAGGAISYVWSNTAATSTIQLSPTAASTLNYTVTGTDNNGCTGTASISVKVNACTGLNEYKNGSNLELHVYPNPNTGEFTIQSNQDFSLNLVNELGQVIKTISLNELNSHKQNISNLAAGIYFMTGEKDLNKVNQKIVVTK